jgi:hypothetical protein
MSEGMVYQIGLEPRRIDVLTSIDGVLFDEAWAARESRQIEELSIAVISRAHLLQNKRATGRPKDLADATWLESTDRPPVE